MEELIHNPWQWKRPYARIPLMVDVLMSIMVLELLETDAGYHTNSTAIPLINF
ncbi:hypothetical protein T07_6417 [Trichinella nelsoni]|uniref:Uncharacterized protein n=1 Tax=Trichinella nelsoni TaxID=6336 RepID=A0A0V0SCY1_9BILA|nr:hypothetical protein T07_6417 [Trichinella nelsoni]